jgi:hypothetical protein
MARRENAHRRLIADGHAYLWRVRHSHAEPECQEIVTVRRYGSAGHARIVFREGTGRAVGGPYLHTGAVVRIEAGPAGEPALNAGSDSRTGSAAGTARPGGTRRYLDLSRPGVVRALLDQALAAGWEPGEEREFDGWEMFDAALRAMSSD